MARLVYQAGKRMREIYNQGLKYTLMYIEGKRYYLRDPRWRDTVSPTDHIYTSISDLTFVVTHTQEIGLNGGEDHISVGVIPFFNAATPIYPNVINIENDDEFTIREKQFGFRGKFIVEGTLFNCYCLISQIILISLF